jgi:hypothetical protein
MRRLLVLVALLALVAAPAARAGGDPLAIAATAGRVWATNGNGAIEYDARNGRILHVAATRYPYTTGLALTGGAVWATSVRNGYVASAVTRIPFDASYGTNPLVLPHDPTFAVASDGRSVWLLAGARSAMQLIRIDAATRRTRAFRARDDIAFVAADDTCGSRERSSPPSAAASSGWCDCIRTGRRS